MVLSVYTNPDLANETRKLSIMVFEDYLLCTQICPQFIATKIIMFYSIESEIALRKLLFLGRLITEPKMVQSVRSLFMSRAESYFDASVASMGVLPSIIEALNKYDLYHFFVSWFHDSTFPKYSNWKCIVKTKVKIMLGLIIVLIILACISPRYVLEM